MDDRLGNILQAKSGVLVFNFMMLINTVLEVSECLVWTQKYEPPQETLINS